MKIASLILVSFLFATLSASAKDKKKADTTPTETKTETAATIPPPAAPVETAAPVIFEEVTLTPMVQLKSTNPADLKAVSHGIRRKKVFGLVPVDVYVAEFYALSPEKLQKSDDTVLDSLPAAGPVQIRLTLKRNLSGSDITKSFKEALKENGINFEQPVTGLSELMTEIEELKSFKKDEVFSLTADWRDGKQQIHVQKPNGSIHSITADDIALKKLFAIWLGKPVDDKMGELKKNLLK